MAIRCAPYRLMISDVLLDLSSSTFQKRRASVDKKVPQYFAAELASLAYRRPIEPYRRAYISPETGSMSKTNAECSNIDA